MLHFNIDNTKITAATNHTSANGAHQKAKSFSAVV